ncbi:hypothetical protein [Oceanobacillus damuensis]|uniref:hypothetical protein n=1 Tax=Oceanobacillus damuensis TaxID=937928 RepID=UPI00082FE6CF|nr:hypothetical protein [Oceanobacillus damuensis]
MKKSLIVAGLLVLGAVLTGALVQADDSLTDEDYREVASALAENEVNNEETKEKIRKAVKDGDLKPEKVRPDSTKGPSEFELTVGGFSDPSFYQSNYLLRAAHTGASIITLNINFNNGGLAVDKESIQETLEHIEERLTLITEYSSGHKKADDIQRAIDLTNQALADGADLGDPILDEIHEIIHELDEYFNVDRLEEEKVDKYGEPINN